MDTMFPSWQVFWVFSLLSFKVFVVGVFFPPLAALSCHMQRENLSVSAVAACDLIGRKFSVKNTFLDSRCFKPGNLFFPQHDKNLHNYKKKKKGKKKLKDCETTNFVISPKCFVFYLHCCDSRLPTHVPLM